MGVLSLDNQDIQTDARIQRQIKYLSKEYKVYVAAYGKEDVPILFADDVKILGSLSKNAIIRKLFSLVLLPLGKLFGSKIYEIWYWNRPGHKEAVDQLIQWKPDFIQANDWWTLPVAVKASKLTNSKIILDF